jgi:ribosomal protein L37AE/L43A
MKLVTPIYCGSHHTTAYFDAVNGVWKCSRCGAKVKVVT